MYFVIQVGNLEAHVFMEKTDYSLKAFGKTAHGFFWCYETILLAV